MLNICSDARRQPFFADHKHSRQQMSLQHHLPLNPVFSVFAVEIASGSFVSPTQESDFEKLATMLNEAQRTGHSSGPLSRCLRANCPAGRSGKNAMPAPPLKQTPAESGEMSEEVLELGGKRCKFGATEIGRRRVLFV
jgi:hypothetical protein